MARESKAVVLFIICGMGYRIVAALGGQFQMEVVAPRAMDIVSKKNEGK